MLVVRRDHLARGDRSAYVGAADHHGDPHHGRTVVSLAAGSTFLYFLQPIISDMVVGTTFLLSLATARPLVARLAGDFYPMTEELRLRPRVQRLFRNLTVMWAVLCIGKASFTLWLLQSQSLEDFVLIKSVTVLAVNMFAAAATIAVATLCARREGPARAAPAARPSSDSSLDGATRGRA